MVELGAGTGRLTRLLAPYVKSIKAFDASAHMLETAAESLREMGLTNWSTEVADHRQIPVEDASADLVISGWSFLLPGGLGWRGLAIRITRWHERNRAHPTAGRNGHHHRIAGHRERRSRIRRSI